MIGEAIKRVVDGQDLDQNEMHRVFSDVMDGKATDVQKSAFLIALRMKGETPDEITGAAMAMRERVTPLDVIDRSSLVDTCGTGGDGRGTFNISTIAALVAAGARAQVAEHGQRACSPAVGRAGPLPPPGLRIDRD